MHSPENIENISERENRWLAEQEKVAALDDLTPDVIVPAFEDDPGTCTCVDEGTDGDIRLAGAGILHPDGLTAVAEILRRGGVTEVTSHDNCGAAKEAYRRAHCLPGGADIPAGAVNDFAKQWSADLGAELSLPHRHIAIDELDRPADWHDASVVYLDFVGHFQPQRVPELPKGFVVSASLLQPEELVAEARLTAGIALSDKGFGQRFSPEQPLQIVSVGTMNSEQRAALANLRSTYGDRLRLTSLGVPETSEAAA